jgi:type I restriction enzyme S subunit
MLLSNLKLLAQAPNGVARLRELIFTLAVQGKLVAQDPNDEPTSELLKKIRAEKDRLIADKKIRRLKPLDSIDDSECGFILPSNWEWERLGNLGDWGAGATPSRSNSYYYGGSIPWFKSGELTADFISESEETVTDAALRDCSLRLNQVGDVLIAMYGATIGKTAILSVVGTTNQAVCACTPFVGLSNTYLLLLMKALKPYFISIGAGGAQPNISREKVVATVIGLPPFAEQSRIVTRVEELMRLCDALEAKGQLEATQHAQLVGTLLATLTDSETPAQLADNWHRTATHFDLLLDRPEAVDALEQTILQLAVRGLLIPQDPQDEPASALLKKIRAEKDKLIAEGKIKRDKPLPLVAEDEQPFVLPMGWGWVRIDEIAEVQGGIQKTQLRRPVKEHYPYLRVANVQRDALRLGEIERFELTHEELNKWRLAAGDLLIVEGNGSADEIGRCAVWDGSIAPCVYQNHLIRVRCLQQDSMAFMKLFLNAPSGMEEMKRLAITTSGLYNLSVGKIRNYVVPMPSLAEQSRIVTRVAQLRRLCADLRQRLSASQSTQAHLAEALVQDVF